MTRPTNKLLEVKLLVDKWVIEETLSRIGIVDYKKKIIYQSCHLFEQFGTYYLAHFKQLLLSVQIKAAIMDLVMFHWKTLSVETE